MSRAGLPARGFAPARARATLETSTRAKSDSRRCRAPFCGDARAGVSAAPEKSAERTVRDQAPARGRPRDGGTDARARDAFLDARGDGNVRGMRGIESRRAMRWARVG